ncbi:MAG: lysozyme inhibitor LprI family protein, partial [Eubacteriales bacterium]|nr:lysozyme inhibitor LprI family protein [Eubacteriales bacterium]
IKADIDYVVSSSTSLQKELENVETVIQKYNLLAEEAQSQGEMNVSSKWPYIIWDTELNNLWSRFSNLADQQTKENILADQRNWVDMKEAAVYESIGTSEENGSMYPLLVNSFLEEITRNRAYVLANELAKIKGESFIMPEKSRYGLFVDNQGTGSIYSSLITRQGVSGDDEAVISIFRLGEIKGVFVDNGNGELSFTSNDADTRIVKGIIKINGWNGASFTVTEAPEGDLPFISVGEEFDFPFAF